MERRFPSVPGVPTMVILVLALAGTALAGTFTVDNLNDGGPGSFRQALIDANGIEGVDQINVAASGTVLLESVLPNISDSVEIVGPGATEFRVERRAEEGVPAFRLLTVDAAVTVNITGVTFANGLAEAASDGSGTFGGGIWNAGTLTLTDVAVEDCVARAADNLRETAAAGAGGGIASLSHLTMVSCRVDGNEAVGRYGTAAGSHGGRASGGGVYNVGDLRIDRTTFSDNSATGGDGGPIDRSVTNRGGAAEGGTIFNSGNATIVATNITAGQAAGGTVTSSTPYYEGGNASGGAIYNIGAMDLQSVSLTANVAEGGKGNAGFGAPGGGAAYGGGVFNGTGGTLAIDLGAISTNIARGGNQKGRATGGGVFNEGEVRIGQTSILSNSARAAGFQSGPSGSGGGFANAASGIAEIVSCTIASNSCFGVFASGGGISSAGKLGLLNSTISENQADATYGGSGSGISAGSGTRIVNCTVLRNGPPYASQGNAGLASGSATVLNSVIAQSRGGYGDPDVSGTFVSEGHNVVGLAGDANGDAHGFTAPTDRVGTSGAPIDTMLGPLADNGGPTLTHLPYSASPLVDAGNDAVLGAPDHLTTDQTGLVARKLGAAVNIGAVESVSPIERPPGVAAITILTDPPVVGDILGYVLGAGTFAVGSQRGIYAQTSPAWEFVRWDDGVTDDRRTITVPPGGATYTAVFRQGRPPDFNGDGLPEIVLFNDTTKATQIWLSGRSGYNHLSGPSLGSSQTLVAVNDFDRDGVPDYLIDEANRERLVVWYLDNEYRVLSQQRGPSLDSHWKVACAMDFNGDTKPDLLLYNAMTRATQFRFLNGLEVVKKRAGPTLPRGYTVAGGAEINGHGDTRILLFDRQTRRTRYVLFHRGTTTDKDQGPAIPGGWSVAGVTFSRDYYNWPADILLHNRTTGATAELNYADGASTEAALPDVVEPGFRIVAP